MGMWLSFVENIKGVDDPYDLNSSFAVIPIDTSLSEQSYKIKFQPYMSDQLTLDSSVTCDVSVIAKHLDMAKTNRLN